MNPTHRSLPSKVLSVLLSGRIGISSGLPIHRTVSPQRESLAH
jgi:hypothetical protein